MSEQPYTPAPVSAEQDAAVRAGLAAQAQAVGGDPTAAGIYGDVAGRGQPTPNVSQEEVAATLAAKGGQAASVDTEALLAQLQAQAEAIQALQAHVSTLQAAGPITVAAEPKPPVLEEIVGALSGASPGIVHALSVIAERLTAAGL